MTTNTMSTSNYKRFSFLVDNRQTARNHINKLKSAISQNPEILEVQPILVNEKMEIIDGQHRFVAASELGLPIHYTMVKGLNIATAREMNILQKRWGVDDYAMSYAKAGNENYKKFNDYRRRYPKANVTTLMIVMSGDAGSKIGYNFRDGRFIITREDEDIEWTLQKLDEIREINQGEIPIGRAFTSAFVQALDNEDFDYDEFKKNLMKKPDMFHRTGTVRDALRMIEDIHNYQKSVNLIRLY